MCADEGTTMNTEKTLSRQSRKSKDTDSNLKQRKTNKDNPNNHKHVRISSDYVKKKKHKKHYRPCSPAAYPSPLPIYDYIYREETSSISSHEDDDNNLLSSDEGNENDIICNNHEKDVIDENNKSEGEIRNQKGTLKQEMAKNFFAFRIHYLIIHIAIMLADGLQGTHLYVLYESYGYTVASLYCLGFVSGAITSPFIGPLVDKIGRRNSAIAYCILEIGINMLEQYDVLAGLIISRVVGGVTTNLLFTVFESWLVTEHRRRGFSEDKLEIVLRDSVVASNLSAIASGCLSHVLASQFGTVGPFQGAVVCTVVALVLVCTRWEENYGCDSGGVQTVRSYMTKACSIIASDSKILRIGLIQGLTEGALQTFVFLWSPALRHLASKVIFSDTAFHIGMDSNSEPAYGLIFGAFMFCGALGGMSEPFVRERISGFLPASKTKLQDQEEHTERMSDVSDITAHDDDDYESISDDEDSLAAEVLTFSCYILCALLLAVPITVDQESPYSFTISLIAFLLYEFLVGLYLPCEGVLRTFFMPNDSICSLMTTLRVIVNVAVALGVISTNYIPFNIAFAACSGALILSAILQFTLIMDKSIWADMSINTKTESVKILNSNNDNDEIMTFPDDKRPEVSGDSSLSTFDSTVSGEAITNHEKEINSNISFNNNGLRQRNVKIKSVSPEERSN